MRTLLLGSVEVIVVTGSTSGVPLALSTRTIFALTIRFRYVAEITRFSSSTKLIAECMRRRDLIAGINRGTGRGTSANVRVHPYVVNCKLQRNGPPLSAGARGFAFRGQRTIDRPAHQRGIFAPEQRFTEARCGVGLHLAIGARPDIPGTQRLDQRFGRLLYILLQVRIGPERHRVDRELAGIGAAYRDEI